MPPQSDRIPAQVVSLLETNSRAVRNLVAMAMPDMAHEAVTTYAIEAVMGVVMRDWWENDNTVGLEGRDIADLESFVRTAAAMAGSELNGSGKPIFQAVLKGLLEDWLANWNANGQSGPPTR